MPDSFDYTTGTNSENVRLLQALIDDAPSYTQETNSRNANILKSIINNTEYTDAPQSEIEELLLRLKAKIGGEIEVDELNVTENGTYDAGVNKAYNPVTVELPLDSKTITENGTYTASSDNLAGFNEVTVAVEGYAKKSIQNTPTPIATFNASALPMPSLSVSIEAVQDLHGYEYPWPAGGGKNKLNYRSEIIEGAFTSQGLTFNENQGKVTVSGRTSGTVWRISEKFTNLPNGNYKVVLSSTDNNLGFALIDGATVIQTFNVGANAFEMTSSKTNYAIGLTASQNVNINGTITFMIILSTETDTSFAPYKNECPITGKSAVNVYDTGKNIFDESILLECSGWTVSDGVYSGDSASVHTKYNSGVPNLKFKPNTQYTFSFTYGQDGSAGIGFALIIRYTDDTVTQKYCSLDTVGFVSVTSTEGKSIKRIELSYGANRPIHLSNMQFEEGTTATTYEAFSGTTYTTPLKDGQGNPLTCYGGQLVNENGVQRLDNTHNSFDMGSVNWSYYNARFFIKIDDIWINEQSIVPTDNQLMCEIYKTVMYSNQPTGTLATWSGYIYVKDDSYNGDTIAFRTAVTGYKIAYEKATPQQITQDSLSIASQDGTNNLWADSGDIQSGEYMEAL